MGLAKSAASSCEVMMFGSRDVQGSSRIWNILESSYSKWDACGFQGAEKKTGCSFWSVVKIVVKGF